MNVLVRDLDITEQSRQDGRRLEVVAEGLSVFGGSQLALDATLVSVLQRDGTARGKADQVDGVALQAARKRKESTYTELHGNNGRTRLVIIAGEVAGRWSAETKGFLWILACEKSREVSKILQGTARAAWYRRWSCLLACAASKVFSGEQTRVSRGRW